MKRFLFLLTFLLTACATGTPNSFVPVAPNVAAESARQTKQAAQAQEDLYLAQAASTSQEMTAVAFAPLAQMTQAAAQLEIQNLYAHATSTSAAATQTAYAEQQALMAQSTNIAGAATQQAAVTQQAFAVQVQSDTLALERAQLINKAKALAVYAFGIVILFLGVAVSYTMIKRIAYIPNPVDERGKPQPMLDVVEGTSWDIDRATNGMLGTSKAFLKLLPSITAERQNEVTARAQLVDMNTRARLPKRLLDSQGNLLLEEPAQPIDDNFLLPSWNIINGWDGKQGIPYYTARGLEMIDIEKFPHLSAIGATGAGKSRRFFRPLIACALAAGHRVVIIGKSADYYTFESHSNAKLMKVNKITETGQAERYAKILEAIIVAMNKRDDILTAAHQSTWMHAGRDRTFIVLDELGNALRLMDSETSRQCRIWVEGLVSEGRKVGFNIVLANQRATGMASILSQTGKAIFRVEADEERAHRSLAGASTLHDGYFLAKFGASKIAGAFEPTDAELKAFLESRPVSKLDEDDWIEGAISNTPEELPGEPQDVLPLPADSMSAWVAGLDTKDLKVLELYQAGRMSNAEIEELAYGYTNGRTARRAKNIIEQYRKLQGIHTPIATTTTTTTPIVPNLGAVAA